MMINTENAQTEPSSPWRNWRGLNGWNFYFILKFALLWYGYLNFHALDNLIFLAFLLFPLSSDRLHRWRNGIAIPIGLGLFYHDTWLPGIHSILTEGSNLFNFSGDYLLELANRFINWHMIGVGFVLLVAYLFISQWIRLTLLTISVIIFLNVAAMGVPITLPRLNMAPANNVVQPTAMVNPNVSTGPSSINTVGNLPPTSANLNAFLNQFYQQEKTRRIIFPSALPLDAQPFDILIINICSLAWSDLEAAQLQKHPLWNKFDVMFNNFNSAASYSGPAAIRLLRANCGQTDGADLYKPVDPSCYWMDSLAKLGFTSQLMLDHPGIFGDFLKQLRQYGNLQAPLMSQAGINLELTSFDGGPIYNDTELLNRWLAQQQKLDPNVRTATFFNVIPLHDGNHFLGENGRAPFKPRAQNLLDELDSFFGQLQKSGRKVMVIVIPEHGDDLTGDKLQMPGLRDLPSRIITNVPVGIKLIGMKDLHQSAPLQINAPTSFLAISELVSRLVDGKAFNAPQVDWRVLTQNLPETLSVGDNDGTLVMLYQGKPYIRLAGDTTWVPYP